MLFYYAGETHNQRILEVFRGGPDFGAPRKTPRNRQHKKITSPTIRKSGALIVTRVKFFLKGGRPDGKPYPFPMV
jgi:hypothetical protein